MFVAKPTVNGSSERGQTMIFVAIMMLVLLGVGAMAVDVGGVMWSRGTEQNAADAAAMAGARELVSNPPAVAEAVALQYAADNGFVNGVDGVTVTAVVSTITEVSTAANNAITVTITRVVPQGLRAAVGAGNITVPARAVAVVAPVMPTCDYWPWGIEENTILYDENGTTIYDTSVTGLPYGKKVVLKVPRQSQVVPGNFLALGIGGNSGANDYRDTIKNGKCLTSTTTVPTEPGNMVGPTSQGVLTHADSAILRTDPCYVQGTNEIDSVFWEVSTSGSPGPHQGLPFTTDWTTMPYALGNPCDPSDLPPLANGNTGPPSATDPFPPVVLPSTTRVGNILILEAGTFGTASGNNGSFDAQIAGAAAFYLIGLQPDASQDYVVGAFLQTVVVKAGAPKFGGDPTGPVGIFLWE